MSQIRLTEEDNGFLIIVQPIRNGLIHGKETREFIKSNLILDITNQIKYSTSYSTCNTCDNNDNGCISQNNCNGYEDYIEKGKTMNITV